MIRQLCIAAALSAFFASMLSGCGGGEAGTATENQVDLPKPPAAAPKIQAAPEKPGATVSKLALPAAAMGPVNAQMKQLQDKKIPATDITGVAFTIGGLADDSECTKAIQNTLKHFPEIEDDKEKMMVPCIAALDKLNKVWIQVDFKEGGVVKSDTAVIDIDGAALATFVANKMKQPEGAEAAEKKRQQEEKEEGKRMINNLDSVNFDMDGLSKITAWVDVSHEFIKSVKNEITLDEATVRKTFDDLAKQAGPPSNIFRHVSTSSLSRAQHLVSKVLFPFSPRSMSPSSVVGRRLAADLTPVPPPSPADACFYELPEAMKTMMNKDNPAKEKENPEIESISFTVGGMSPTGDCCTKVKAFDMSPPKQPANREDAEATEAWDVAMKAWDAAMKKAAEEIQTKCMEELPKLNGMWFSAKFTPTAKVPLTGASGFSLIDGPKYAKYMEEVLELTAKPPPEQQAAVAKFGMKYAKQALDGFERFAFAVTYSKTQAWYAFKNFLVTKSAEILTYDETKLKALIVKGEESEAQDRAEQAVWKLFQLAHAPNMINMINLMSKSPLVKTESASRFTVGAVSLVGSLVLIGVVAGAFITRRRGQVRNIQNVEARQTATEMTSQEVA